MRRSILRSIRMAGIAGLALFVFGCASRTEPIVATRAAGPGLAPALAVERFLQAANARDYNTMARLFGTRSGSILARDPHDEVEQRMYVLASLLRHDDYALESETVAPGRLGEAVRITVGLKVGARRFTVPFTVVRTDRQEWLVEQIEIETITAGV